MRKELGEPLYVAVGYCDLGSEYLIPPYDFFQFCFVLLLLLFLFGQNVANKSEGLEMSYGLDTRPLLITTNVPHVDDDQFEFQPLMYGRRDHGHTPQQGRALIWSQKSVVKDCPHHILPNITNPVFLAYTP